MCRLPASLLALALTCFTAVVADSAIYLVGPDGSGDFPTIQAALTAASAGDEVVLAPGTFAGEGNYDLSFQGKALVLRSSSGDASDTIIDASGGRGFIFDHGETRDARVEGITIQDAFLLDHNTGGGAVFCRFASPTFRSCVFRHCGAELGAAVHAIVSSPLFQFCTFADQVFSTSTKGGGIYARSCDLTVEDCEFNHNLEAEGGAIWTESSTVHITRSVFLANGIQGGGLWCENYSFVTLTGSTFYSDFSEDAQIVLRGGSGLTADHSIVAFGSGRAIQCEGGASATLSCCDLFGNPNGDWVGCVAGQDALAHNLSLDPHFCSGYLDVHLRSDSPCSAEYNQDCGQIGARGIACDLPVAVERLSWGAVKATYR